MQRSLTIILSLILLFNYALSSTCSSYFESQMKSTCESLTVNTTHSCAYSKGKCDFSFKSCSSYTGTDSKICSSIVLSNVNKKCEIQSNVCTEVYKTCDEYDSSLSMTCSYLSAGNNKKCRLNNNKCEAHYNKCADFTTGVDATKCQANIPSNTAHKCIWKNDACTEVDKECTDYTSIAYSSCSSLSTSSTDKVCVSTTNGYCKEQYKTCELYNTKETSKTKADCEAIIYYSGSTIDNSKICEFTDSTKTCSTRDKECKDITGEYLCEYFTPKDTDKICVYVNSQCKEQYKTCELYNTKVTEANKKSEDCKAIQIYISYNNFDTSSKCVYDDTTKTCSKRKKECSDFTTESTCNSYRPEDTNKKCIFISNKCEEQYKTCELYNAQSTKNADTCNKIQPYETTYDSLDAYSKCVYEDSQCKRVSKSCSELTESYCSNHVVDDDHICFYEDNQCKQVYKSCSSYNKETNKNEANCKKVKEFNSYGSYGYIDYSYKCVYKDGNCEKQKLTKCEDYESGLEEYYCTYITFNSNKKCVFNNNRCETKYTECPGSSGDVITKEVCEAITPSTNYYKCELDSNNKCVQVRKKCSEYNGTYPYNCYNCATSDNNKKCVISEGKCVEKYAKCSSYTGTNEAECKSIIPYNDYGTSLENSQKCVYESNKCVMKKKECSEMKTKNLCENLSPDDTDKQCVYINNNCEEQYLDCDTYSNNEKEDVVQTKCEAIKLKDSSYKCVFHSNAAKKCQKEQKLCSEIKNEDYEDTCTKTYPNYYSKCEFSDSTCNQVNKTCLELEIASSATSDICSLAATSGSNKECKLKEDNTGCEEKETKKNGDAFLSYKLSLLLIIFGLLL